MDDDTRIISDLEVLKALQGEINRRMGGIEKDLESKYVTYSEHKHVVDDLAELEGTKVWMVRLVMGTLVLELIALLFAPKIQALIG